MTEFTLHLLIFTDFFSLDVRWFWADFTELVGWIGAVCISRISCFRGFVPSEFCRGWLTTFIISSYGRRLIINTCTHAVLQYTNHTLVSPDILTRLLLELSLATVGVRRVAIVTPKVRLVHCLACTYEPTGLNIYETLQFIINSWLATYMAVLVFCYSNRYARGVHYTVSLFTST